MKKLTLLTQGFVVALLLACWVCPVFSMDNLDHDNVVIVLDASGSMDSSMPGGQKGARIKKMMAAKHALLEVLNQVPETTHIGLLVFSSRNIVDPWVYPLGPRDNDLLTEAIMKPEPKGGTPLGKYIKLGADRLLEQRQAQYGYGTYRLLIVTDGEAQDKSLMERYVPEAMARGITLDVIGVDMSKSHTLATQVHSYRSANNPDSLTQAIADVFAEIADSGSDTTDEDAFAEIAPIPHEMASELLRALATSGNSPIGESEITNTSSTVNSSSSSNSAVSSQGNSSKQDKKKEQKSPLNFKLITVIIVFVIVIRSIKKRK